MSQERLGLGLRFWSSLQAENGSADRFVSTPAIEDLRKPIPIEHGAATVGGDNRLLHSIEQACLKPDFLLGSGPMDLRPFSSVARFIEQLSQPCVLGLKLSFALGVSPCIEHQARCARWRRSGGLRITVECPLARATL